MLCPAQTLTKHRTTTRKPALVLLEACGLRLHSSRQHSTPWFRLEDQVTYNGEHSEHRVVHNVLAVMYAPDQNVWKYALPEPRRGFAILGGQAGEPSRARSQAW